MASPELSSENLNTRPELPANQLGALNESLRQSSETGSIEQADYVKFRDIIAGRQDDIARFASRAIHGPDAPHLREDLVQNVNEYLLRYGQKYRDSLKNLIDPSKPYIIKNLLWIAVQNMAKSMFKTIRKNPLYNRDEIYEEGINRSAATGETTFEKLPQFVDLKQESRITDAIDANAAASSLGPGTAERLLQLENPNLIQALTTLKDTDREILLLRLEGLDDADIASKLEITIAAAEKRIERAKKELKEQLETA